MKRIALLSALLAATGCEVSSNPSAPGQDGGGGGGSPDSGAMMPRPDAWTPPPFDPFDPANACGVSTVPTQQVPGSLLIVFDRSGSMSDEVGGSTRWELAKAAINNALATSGDELSAGLLLFPSDGNCGVPSTPNVPVAPLSTSRAAIQSVLNSTSPSGNTPAFKALLAGYDHLDTLTTPGQQGIVLVTDGGETCDLEDREEIFARVQMERVTKNRLTFAVGLQHADNNLSTIAYNGGSPRSPTCMPECTTNGSCFSDADCGGAPCLMPSLGGPLPIPLPGICSCANDSHCVGEQTCQSTYIPLYCQVGSDCKQCAGPTNCCHYDASDANFQSEFESALGEIARRLVDSCVFEVPRGTDPSMFDPARVNVGVTFEGEDRTVLRRGYDPNVDSWNYTDDTYESLIIQGPICDRILEGEPATVEIVLGCPTIII